MSPFTLRFGIGLAVVLATDLAFAADIIPPYVPPPPAPYTPPPVTTYSWTGAYGGITAGYGWGGKTIDNQGWIGGGYVGFNVQRNSNIVLGVEVDGTLTSKSGTAGTTSVSNPWNATLRGRIGYALDRIMIYGTGGLAVGGIKVEDTVGPTSETTTRVGWTAGAGVETALTDKVLGRVEYRYTDLGSSSFTPGTISSTSHDVMVGIGFKF